jgi:hypothetical protein
VIACGFTLGDHADRPFAVAANLDGAVALTLAEVELLAGQIRGRDTAISV